MTKKDLRSREGIHLNTQFYPRDLTGDTLSVRISVSMCPMCTMYAVCTFPAVVERVEAYADKPLFCSLIMKASDLTALLS